MSRTKVTSVSKFNKLNDDDKVRRINALISLYADIISRDQKIIDNIQEQMKKHEATLEELKEIFENKDFEKFKTNFLDLN